jgi:cell division septation protein DedD
MRKSHIVLLAMLTAVTFGIAGCSHVADDWKAAQSADTAEGYQDFLRQHPDSEFGVNAQERIKQLAEDRDWQQAATADTLDAYQQFVAAHADGKWAQEARVRIENFQLNGSSQAAATASAVPGMVAPSVPGASAPTVAGAAPAPAAKPAPAPKPAAAPKPAPVTSKAGKHLAQLGAFSSHASAEAAWHKLTVQFPGDLKSLQPHYVTAKSHDKTVVRLQVGLSSAQHARDLCAALKKKSQPCVPLS